MPDWKRVRINFPTIKLGQFIEPIKETIAEKSSEDFKMVYGVTNVEGITITGKKASKDISNYIVIDKNYFAYNPYRINVGSIGFNSKGLKGCVSPAYVVFRAKNNLSPGFLYVYLKSEFGNHLINWYGNRGGVRNALRYDDLCEIDIPDIDYKTQIELLNKIDRSKISLNSFSEEITQQLEHLKQLRQQILQEAIEGKLTAKWRDKHPELISGDNHASKLLEKIKAEKECLIKEGKIKKDKPLAPITEAEKPFDLPDGWVWSKLGDAILHLPRNGYPPKEVARETSIKSLKLGATTYGKFNPREFKYIADEIPKDSVFWLEPEDILIQRSNSLDYVGVSAIYTGKSKEFIYPDLMMKIKIMRPLSVNLIYNFLSSPLIRDYFRSRAKGSQQTMPKINQGVVINVSLPTPPIDEQTAIIERVDKFMGMIDKLEKQVSECKEQSEMLMQSVLREAFADNKYS